MLVRFVSTKISIFQLQTAINMLCLFILKFPDLTESPPGNARGQYHQQCPGATVKI